MIVHSHMGLKISIISIILHHITLQSLREARRKMPYLVNFEQIFYEIERHFGLKDTPNHLELKFMGKNNKKPFGLKIQSTTSDQLHPIPFKSLKSLL